MGNIYEELKRLNGGARRYATTSNFRGELDSEIEQVISRIEVSVKNFDQKDRKSILGTAAGAVRKEARLRTIKGSRTTLVYKRRPGVPKRNNRKRTNKKSNNKEVENVGSRGGRLSSSYVAGNLEKSIKVLRFPKSPDVFVGPNFRGKGNIGVGTSTTNADGFYADLAYGGTGEFKRKVLEPAAAASEKRVIELLRKAAIKRLKGRAKEQGLDVG
jgi:hypothetical protein